MLIGRVKIPITGLTIVLMKARIAATTTAIEGDYSKNKDAYIKQWAKERTSLLLESK